MVHYCGRIREKNNLEAVDVEPELHNVIRCGNIAGED